MRACLNGRGASNPLEARSFDADFIFAGKRAGKPYIPLLAGRRSSQLLCRKPDGLHVGSPDDTAGEVVHNAGNGAYR